MSAVLPINPVQPPTLRVQVRKGSSILADLDNKGETYKGRIEPKRWYAEIRSTRYETVLNRSQPFHTHLEAFIRAVLTARHVMEGLR